MALKTLDPKVKSAFQNAGLNLSATEEHLATLGGIDWAALIAKLGAMAGPFIQALLAVLAILNPPPNPTPAMQAAAPGCPCCHHDCCTATLKLILKAAESEAKHLCQCCEGGYG